MISSLPVFLSLLAAPATTLMELPGRTAGTVGLPGPSVSGGLFVHEPPESGLQSVSSHQWNWSAEDRPVLREIAAYQALESGWDGSYGKTALVWSISAAIAFVDSLPPDLPDPVSMISPSGEVSLYWIDGNAYAEIGFNEDNTCYMFTEVPGQESIHFNDVSPDDDRLFEALRVTIGLEKAQPLAA